uniref:Methyltransferase small domain-containing protein n=1 Tax=Aegilops tauschii subsp. strangulata TaxID=200361 RepID=A0A453MBX6_AEGTS
ALEYEERIHKFPGVDLSIREFSSHQLNANLLWPGTFFFADWLVKNPSILDGQRILELGSGTGALAIFLRKTFGVDITTSDYDDKDIEENIAHNCRVNKLDVLPHIRHTWGDPFPILQPDWNIVIASDILLCKSTYYFLPIIPHCNCNSLICYTMWLCRCETVPEPDNDAVLSSGRIRS